MTGQPRLGAKLDAASTDAALGRHTRAEIWSQDIAWASAARAIRAQASEARRFFGRHPASIPIFVGCGSPYHLCETVAAAFERMSGRQARVYPGGELMLGGAGQPALREARTVVAVSRSGETTELLAACELLRSCGAQIVAVTPSIDSSLTQLADWSVTLPDADEVSLAQTRSFGAMLIATIGLAAIAAGRESVFDELDEVARLASRVLKEADELTDAAIQDPFERVVFLGSGSRFGLAREGLVKTVEMSLTDSSAYHVLEIRHGPQALVDERTLVVGLLDPDGSAAESAVLRDMRDLGATVLSSGTRQDRPAESQFLQADVYFPAASPAHLVAILPLLQLVAFKQAMRRAIDPDLPRNLNRYVDLAELG